MPSRLLLAGLAALTGLLGLLAALAPVTADDPVVTWPRAGEAPTSTVLPLAPYRPLSLDATVPCDALRDRGEALRTLPADVGETAEGLLIPPSQGLLVASARGTVTVRASGVEVLAERLPPGPCTYRVVADAGGVVVSRDGARVGAADVLVPQVAQLATDAPVPGLAVELHTDARYQSTATPLKVALLVAHAVALAALLALAWRRWRGAGPGLVRPRWSWADGAVVAVSLAWAVLAPVNIDDSWYSLMARNAEATGYIGNYVYQFNVSENPFPTSQYLLAAWGGLGGWGLLWLRVLPLVYGLVAYALLRVLVTSVVPRVATARVVAAAHLLWWLPYGMTLRPEPLSVVGSAAVLVLAELARRRESIGVLAVATAVAALTVTVAPAGLVAAAPLVVSLPWVLRWLRAAGWRDRAGAVLLAGAAPSVVVAPAFADATLGDVLSATSVHRWYYRQYSWYAEYFHYAQLLDASETGAWAKRLPVLLTLAVLLGAVIATARRAGTGGPVGRLLAGSALLTGLALLALIPTPTKWVNHFGAVAAPATVLLAAALLRSPVPRRAPVAARAVVALAAGAAAAVSFAGPNVWRPFTDWGQPFGDHSILNTPYELSETAPAFGPVELRNPLLWLAVLGAALWWARRRRRVAAKVPFTANRAVKVPFTARSALTPDRAVLLTATAVGIPLLLAVFVIAPLRQYPGPSVASMNLQALGGDACGLAGDVRVQVDGEPRPVTDLTAGRPVFADQVSAALWPCVDQIAVVHGLVEVPEVRLRASDGLEESIGDVATFPNNGGTLAQLDRTARFVELPSALEPPGAPTLGWGHVERVVPDHPPMLVDLRVEQERRWGWERLPNLASLEYAGRVYVG